MPGIDVLLSEARERLVSARALVAHEIASYPTPIAGCDVQFNHLLADRQRILQALDALSQEAFVPTPRMPAPVQGLERR